MRVRHLISQATVQFVLKLVQANNKETLHKGPAIGRMCSCHHIIMYMFYVITHNLCLQLYLTLARSPTDTLSTIQRSTFFFKVIFKIYLRNLLTSATNLRSYNMSFNLLTLIPGVLYYKALLTKIPMPSFKKSHFKMAVKMPAISFGTRIQAVNKNWDWSVYVCTSWTCVEIVPFRKDLCSSSKHNVAGVWGKMNWI